MFVIQKTKQVSAHWQQVTAMLRKQFPGAVPVMDAAKEDVPAFLHFPYQHWRKTWSTNPLESLNKEIKRRTIVVGIFPIHTSIIKLLGSQLLEQQEEWQLECRRFFSEPTMAKIPFPKEPLELGRLWKTQRSFKVWHRRACRGCEHELRSAELPPLCARKPLSRN